MHIFDARENICRKYIFYGWHYAFVSILFSFYIYINIYLFYHKTQARIKIPCAGMFTILESGPISDQVNDYTDLLLMCLLL